MAGILKHRYVNPHADVAGSTKTQASHWNDFLTATGGAHGDALTRDTADAVYGMKWTAGGVAGVWQDVAFSASYFGAVSPLTWIVAAGDMNTFRYAVIGKTLIWALYLIGGTLGGSAGGNLVVVVPGGLTLSGQCVNRVSRCQNAGTYREAEIFQYAPTQIGIRPVDLTNWTTGALNLGFTASLFIA